MAHKQAEGVQYSNTHAGERLGSVGLWEVITGCAKHHISPDSAECLFCSKFNLFLCFDFSLSFSLNIFGSLLVEPTDKVEQ